MISPYILSIVFIVVEPYSPAAKNAFGITVLLSIFLSVGGYLLYQRTKWRRKFSFNGLKFNTENLLGAHICLGALMIQADRKKAKEKITYMSSYFQKHFNETGINLHQIITEAFTKPINKAKVALWLNRYMKYNQKTQIVYFLAGMSVVDGGMDAREIKLLREISDLLQLTPKDFDSIIAMYQQKRERQQSKSKEQPKTETAKSTIIQVACKVLGVSDKASMEEIKKAYRTLVKKHHPDKFFSAPKQQQDLANERFLEIQKSYELIEKYK